MATNPPPNLTSATTSTIPGINLSPLNPKLIPIKWSRVGLVLNDGCCVLKPGLSRVVNHKYSHMQTYFQ